MVWQFYILVFKKGVLFQILPFYDLIMEMTAMTSVMTIKKEKENKVER